mmetsp:Transcript_35131/g.78809  ORF Transcript_35131/g.78809 Transcript_35131/m.78809 type:complete len:212 (-) Transcript_35131:195-830(-)
MRSPVAQTAVLSPFRCSMQIPSRTSNISRCSCLCKIDSHVVAPLTYCGRQPISSSVALEHTACRATSSTSDQFRVDTGWRHPKDLHVKARLSSSRAVPRNEEIWAMTPESMQDRSTVAVMTTGSTSWFPSACPRRRSRSFSDLSSAFLPRSCVTSWFAASVLIRSCAISDSSSAILLSRSNMTAPPSSDGLSLFALPSSAILGGHRQSPQF